MRYILLFVFLSSCGFGSDAEYNQSRLGYSNDCKGLTMKDRYAYNSQNEGSTRQTYKIQTKENKKGYNYNLHHSYLNDNNFLGRVAIEKNIKDRVCKDNYLRDVRLLDKK